MIRVLFVCHGNICRSPMAEFVFRDMAQRAGCADLFEVASAGTSAEELGNPVYPPVRRLLEGAGISCRGKRAYKLNKSDYDKYDLLICMEPYNVRNLMRIIGTDPENKVHLLGEYGGENVDLSDPYYTGDYETVWRGIHQTCQTLLETLLEENKTHALG